MGCKNTKNTAAQGSVLSKVDPEDKALDGEVMPDGEGPAPDEEHFPELTDRQKDLILDTWKPLVDNISNVGVITFMNLFETHPDVQDVFMPFKGLSPEELRHSKELRAHGLRVMGFVQKVVARFGEPRKAEGLLRELGRNHIMYGARRDYVDLIGPQFVFSVKPTLGDHWSEEAEEAWLQLFRYMAAVMRRAMADGASAPTRIEEALPKMEEAS